MLAFLWWLIIGLIAGGLARLLIPGRQPMSLLMTLLLGLAGSVVGGLISTILFSPFTARAGFHTGGLIMSTLGAVIVLALYIKYARRPV